MQEATLNHYFERILSATMFVTRQFNNFVMNFVTDNWERLFKGRREKELRREDVIGLNSSINILTKTNNQY